MTKQGLVIAGAVVVALAFMIYFTDVVLQPAAFVRVGEVEVGDVSEGTAARIGIFAIIFLAGIGMITAGLKFGKGSLGRKLKSRAR